MADTKSQTTKSDRKNSLTGDYAHNLAQSVLFDIEENCHTRPDYVERLAKVIRNYGDERAKTELKRHGR